MSEDTKLQQLIINTLSPEQMPEVLSETEIYLVEDDVEYASIEELATKQNIITDLNTIRNNASTGAGLAPQVAVNTQRIEELTTAKFPNVVIIGTPHIEGGQVTNYSDTSYLQFPFVDISRGQPFDIYFSFTTSNDVTTQQNILDSYFGIALAIQNSKGIMALSSNGSSWDIGTSTGTNTLLPNTTYYVKYSWTGTAYSAALSTNETEYIPDMNLTSSLSPHKTTIFIGGSPNLFGPASAHPFKGTINFNKSKVVVNGITVWEGMADVGLASRANVSLNNLDEVGEKRFADKANISDLATVATSGNYNDLSNKPTIPSAVTESTVSGWGFTKNTGTYSKPSTGIPKTDLASAVQTSLGKADTAIQSTADCVKTSGNQTVAGVKTFTGVPVFENSSYGALVVKRNDTTSSTGIKFRNNNGDIGSIGLRSNGKPFENDGTLDRALVRCTEDKATGSASQPVYIDANGIATAVTNKTWTGTLAQYNAIATKDANTLYYITDDVNINTSILQTMYPVNSVFITYNLSKCPLADLFGTWVQVGGVELPLRAFRRSA